MTYAPDEPMAVPVGMGTGTTIDEPVAPMGESGVLAIGYGTTGEVWP